MSKMFVLSLLFLIVSIIWVIKTDCTTCRHSSQTFAAVQAKTSKEDVALPQEWSWQSVDIFYKFNLTFIDTQFGDLIERIF